MPKNMGLIDRVIRIVFAVAMGALIAAGTVTGWLAVVLGAFAVIFLVTSLVSFCPLYLPFKINTGAKKS